MKRIIVSAMALFFLLAIRVPCAYSEKELSLWDGIKWGDSMSEVMAAMEYNGPIHLSEDDEDGVYRVYIPPSGGYREFMSSIIEKDIIDSTDVLFFTFSKTKDSISPEDNDNSLCIVIIVFALGPENVPSYLNSMYGSITSYYHTVPSKVYDDSIVWDIYDSTTIVVGGSEGHGVLSYANNLYDYMQP